MIPITIGEIIFPSKIPNLNHNLFNGVNSLEFIRPKTRKENDIINDQILISSEYKTGYIEIIKKK